ncbi:hypothetical protein ES703_57423 [subsurface metagenome]
MWYVLDFLVASIPKFQEWFPMLGGLAEGLDCLRWWAALFSSLWPLFS